MKIRLSCWQCEGDRSLRSSTAVPLNDGGTYVLECSEHGRNLINLQNPRFELLFEAAVLALCEDRTRDAVLDLGASLERFIEFYLDYTRLGRAVTDDHQAAFWKTVKVASERQLGAFLVCYLLENGEPAPLPVDWAPFRNRVIHQGYIPSMEETLAHGEALRQFTYRVLDRARWNNRGALMSAILKVATLRVQRDVASAAALDSTSVHLPTLVSTLWNEDRPTLAGYIERQRAYTEPVCPHCKRSAR